MGLCLISGLEFDETPSPLLKSRGESWLAQASPEPTQGSTPHITPLLPLAALTGKAKLLSHAYGL